MFKKKLKIKVKHYGRHYYCIEYSYGYFNIIWLKIKKFIWINNTDRFINGWNPVLKNYEDAIYFSKQFNTIEDIYNWYKVQKEIENNFKIAYENHKHKNKINLK